MGEQGGEEEERIAACEDLAGPIGEQGGDPSDARLLMGNNRDRI